MCLIFEVFDETHSSFIESCFLTLQAVHDSLHIVPFDAYMASS